MTDTNTDDEIRALLAGHPGLVALLRDEIDAAINAMRALWWAPHQYVRFRAERLGEQLRACYTPDERARDVAHYRLLLAARQSFNELRERVAKGPAGSKEFAAECEREIDEWCRVRASRPVAAPPPFDARGFVEQLARRGIALRVSGKGIAVSPATMLTDGDRSAMIVHRTAILDAVAALTEIV